MQATGFKYPIEIEQAAQFIHALAGSSSAAVTFQTFDDNLERKNARPKGEGDPLAQIRHGSLQQHAAWLEEMNRRGAGIYVTVNATNLRGRKESDIVALRAVFVDDDQEAIAHPDDLPLKPSMAIRAKRGLHLYWLLVEGQAVSRFRDAQLGLVHTLGTDRQIIDPSRVMRLPGFYHMKDPGEPFLVTIEDVQPAMRYTLDQVEAAYPPPPKQERPTAVDVPARTFLTPAAEMFARWAAYKPIEDGTRHDALKAIIAEGVGRVNAGAITESEAISVVLDYCRRSGIKEGEKGGLKLWNHMRSKNFTANLPDPVVHTVKPSKSPAGRYPQETSRADYPNEDEPMPGEDEELQAVNQEPSRYKLYSPADLAGLPPLSYQVDQHIIKGGFSVLYGPSGGGKTFVGLDLALCISEGLPWAGYVVTQGHVVYVSGEGISGLSQRIKAWQIHNDKLGELEHIHFITQAVNLRDKADVVELVKQIRTLPVKPALVVLDTLARCMVGGDENSAKDLGEAIAAVDYIRAQTGGGVLLVHHTAKAKPEQERGSSALRGAADTMILVSKKNGQIALSCEKQKDAAPFETSFWKLAPIEAVGSCVPTLITGDPGGNVQGQRDGQKKQAEKELSENDRLVLRIVRERTEVAGGINLSEVARVCDLSKSSAGNSLKRLRNRAFILFDSETSRYHSGRPGLNLDDPGRPWTTLDASVQVDEGPDYGYVPVNQVMTPRPPVQSRLNLENLDGLDDPPDMPSRVGGFTPPIGGVNHPGRRGGPGRSDVDESDSDTEVYEL